MLLEIELAYVDLEVGLHRLGFGSVKLRGSVEEIIAQVQAFCTERKLAFKRISADTVAIQTCAGGKLITIYAQCFALTCKARADNHWSKEALERIRGFVG